MDEFEMEEMEQPEFTENDNPQPKRTTFLLVLCILTFIGSGYSLLYYLLLPLAKAHLPEMMDVYRNFFKDEAMLNQMNEMFNFMAAVPSWKYLLVALGFAGSVTGAALMLKLRKEGLHVYIISQILIFALLSFLIGGPMKSTINDILWIIIFILLYFLQLKKSNVRF
jgi:hypothetical protein